ncbi:CFEM domain-containing protein [Colletotrichum karsti]|uniref:CFEM domain-containing protein n=1 Tax=Colletotrichum karsti TaxID=1095194 RepID=A0A9P6LEK0_9PEZI|nr:CFEM domain-containing protein [Colletotrichum karsti]KAF9873254.1 CFEM domain-containing protein [Colletotrichum karsti]
MSIKFARLSRWGADDVTVLLAYIFLLGFLPDDEILEKGAAGKDVWTITFKQMSDFFLSGYIAQILYHSCMALIKASIIFFLLRIFTDGKTRIVLWCTQAINAMIGATFLFAGLFQCSPVDLVWKLTEGFHEGHCINVIVLTVAHAAINIVLDVWILIIPSVRVWKMNMRTRDKWAASAMFSLGLFLTITSIIRLRAIQVNWAGAFANPTGMWYY